jgi:hypothetical protein
MKILPILLVMLMILATPAMAAWGLTIDFKRGVTPDSPIWKAELFIESIQERFIPSSKEKHAQERQEEILVMVEEGKARATEKIHLLMEEKKIEVKAETLRKIDDKFKITPTLLTDMKDYLNEVGGGNEKIWDGRYLIKIIHMDNTILFYDMIIEDKFIKAILYTSEDVNKEAYAGELTITQGQLVDLTTNKNLKTLLGILKDLKEF